MVAGQVGALRCNTARYATLSGYYAAGVCAATLSRWDRRGVDLESTHNMQGLIYKPLWIFASSHAVSSREEITGIIRDLHALLVAYSLSAAVASCQVLEGLFSR